MNANKMHADQIATDADLVRRLVEAQFPRWAGLIIEPIASDGTANDIYRLGHELAVRMPLELGPGKLEQIDKEHRWLPEFAPQLPLSVPVPLAKGVPGEGYPAPWTVCEWIEGENGELDSLLEPTEAAVQLAEFVRTLQDIDSSSGPSPGDHNFHRGVPLASQYGNTHWR